MLLLNDVPVIMTTKLMLPNHLPRPHETFQQQSKHDEQKWGSQQLYLTILLES